MKVTKKVRLLARPATRVIAIRDMSVNSRDQAVDMTVENFDGVKGYYVVGPDTVVRIDGKVRYPDGAEEELDFYGNTETGRFHADLDGEHHYASVGETVKVTLLPDPAKHDIVQTPAEASAESYPPDDE